MINDKLLPKLCCPVLFGTIVSVESSSANVSCTKALQIVPGSRILTCISCNMKMRADKYPCIFNCQLTFADLTLSLPVHVASKYFTEDVVELFKKDETGFRMTLCLLENVDFTYNSKSIITSMTDHPQNVFLDLVWKIKSKNLFVKCTFISIHGTWIFEVMVTTVVIRSYSVVVPRSTVLIH